VTTEFNRLPVRFIPGFDCIYDNANCPGCKQEREQGFKPRSGTHGISGGRAMFVVVAKTKRRRVAIVLEAFMTKYPSTIPTSHWRGSERVLPHGGTLSLHVENRSSGSGQCDWLGGLTCKADILGLSIAHDLYRAHGNMRHDCEPHEQRDSLWVALEERLADALRDVERAEGGRTIREAVALAIEGLSGSPIDWVVEDPDELRHHVMRWVADYAKHRGVLLEPNDIATELHAIVEQIKERG
jgi:hypothetical protein